VTGHLARDFDLNVTGIDVLDFNIAEARKRAARLGLDKQVSFRQMSYAELDFPDESFDGVYTMETLVHAADAEAVLEQFHRVLKSGGRLVLFEYSRTPESQMPKRAANAFREVNEVAAMPSFQRFDHGVLEQLVEKSGFAAVTVEDITTQMLPMLRCFDLIARLPYTIAHRLHRQDRLINAMSAVEFWRYRDYFRYNVYTADKRLAAQPPGEARRIDGHSERALHGNRRRRPRHRLVAPVAQFEDCQLGLRYIRIDDPVRRHAEPLVCQLLSAQVEKRRAWRANFRDKQRGLGQLGAAN
jgi:sterol 24-C-methyltransferase